MSKLKYIYQEIYTEWFSFSLFVRSVDFQISVNVCGAFCAWNKAMLLGEQSIASLPERHWFFKNV